MPNHCDVMVHDIGKCHLPTYGAHDLRIFLMKRDIELVSLGDEYTLIRPDKVVGILRGLMGTLIKFEDGTHVRAGISVEKAKAIVARELRHLAKHKRMTPATAAPGG